MSAARVIDFPQPASNTEPRTFAPGDLVSGAYRLERKLGEGGFSTVFLAEQVALGRKVAVKILDVVRVDEEEGVAVERFMREARAAASIVHPNVVTVFDVGYIEEGRPYIVMEPFEGLSLDDLIAERGAIPVEEAVPMICDALSALAAAHELGIVHRDLKPDNLIVEGAGTRRQTLKVIDFGVARLMDSSAQLTQQHSFIGTLPYLPAEYVVNSQVTTALDVYQMGLTLLECITGRPVLEGNNPLHLLHLITSRAFSIPQEIADSRLGEVIARSLAPIDERYPDAAAMLEALEAIPADQLMQPVPATSRLPSQSRDAERPATDVVPRPQEPPPTSPARDEPTVPMQTSAPAQAESQPPAKRPLNVALIALIALIMSTLAMAGVFAIYLALS